jgi:hypothetical protein
VSSGVNPTPIRPGPPARDAHIVGYYVLVYADTRDTQAERLGEGLGHQGAAERRAEARSRCAEHGGNCDSACLARVCCAPAVVMVAPQTILRNASRAQSEGRAKEGPKSAAEGYYKGRSSKAPAPMVPRSGPRGKP